MQSALIISLSDFSNRRMDMDSSQITQLRREIAAFSFSIPSDQDRADHWGDLGAGFGLRRVSPAAATNPLLTSAR
jgi:hypothetical protein